MQELISTMQLPPVVAPAPLLTAYSLPYVMGYLAARNGERTPNPCTLPQLMQLSHDWGLSGIEAPLGALAAAFDGTTAEQQFSMDEFISLRTELDLRVVADYGAILDYDADHLKAALQLAARAGAPTLRVIASHLLCGDRRPMQSGWPNHLGQVAIRLKEALPYAHDLGICIAIENHQDATTEDLLNLADMVHNHPAFGITLDTGNPLAVAQDPLDAAVKLAPIIRHLHMKDYSVHFCDEGYRLVRCPAGTGVVPFAQILAALRGNGCHLAPGVEVAAQATRTIPVLDIEWWEQYGKRDARDFAHALQTVWRHGQPATEPYGSAWERGEPGSVIADEEWSVAHASVEFVKSLCHAS